MGKSPVEKQTPHPTGQKDNRTKEMGKVLEQYSWVGKRTWDLVGVSDLNLYLWLSAHLHLLASEALEAQDVLRWNHLSLSYPPNWPFAMFLNLCFPHPSSGPSQKLRRGGPGSCLLPHPSIQLESRFCWSYLLNLSVLLPPTKFRPSALFLCIIRIVRCPRSGLPWIQPSQQCHCNLLKT